MREHVAALLDEADFWAASSDPRLTSTVASLRRQAALIAEGAYSSAVAEELDEQASEWDGQAKVQRGEGPRVYCAGMAESLRAEARRLRGEPDDMEEVTTWR